MESKSKPYIIIALSSALTALLAAPAFAHRILLEMRGDDAVAVRYDDGTPARQTSVRLYDDDGNVIASGATDAQGVFNFDPSLNPYRAVADDGMGHRAEWMEGRIEAIDAIPLWLRAALGLGILLFIGAVFYFRGLFKSEAENS